MRWRCGNPERRDRGRQRQCGADPGCALVDDVVAAAVKQERLEGWIMREVDKGTPLPGLYPPNAETAAHYQAWADQQKS